MWQKLFHLINQLFSNRPSWSHLRKLLEREKIICDFSFFSSAWFSKGVAIATFDNDSRHNARAKNWFGRILPTFSSFRSLWPLKFRLTSEKLLQNMGDTCTGQWHNFFLLSIWVNVPEYYRNNCNLNKVLQSNMNNTYCIF